MEIKKVVIPADAEDSKDMRGNEEVKVKTVSDRFVESIYRSYHTNYNDKNGNDSASNEQEIKVQEVTRQDDMLESYRFLKEQNASFKISFDILRPDGSYMVLDNDVVVVLKQPTTSKNFRKSADHVIGRPVNVIIDSIDETERIVYVHNVARIDAVQIRIIDALDSAIQRGEKVLVSGKIVAVFGDICIVDIFEKGIFGGCSVVEWRKGYVRSLQSECTVGEIYDFYVIDKKNVKGRNGKRTEKYVLDRRDLANDEWEKLKENKAFYDILQNKGTIILKCIEIPEGKSYWWGVSDTIKGIELMCDYTKAAGRIEKGSYYKCFVKVFDPKKRIIKCTPYTKVTSNAMNNAAMTAKKLMQSMKKGE